GVARLAWFNATVEKLKDKSGKVRFFEGTPIPTTVLIAMMILFLVSTNQIGDNKLPGGKILIAGWTFHPFVL
ncbi:tRNA1(Val), partial [Nowakowskiella sp. JEL0078]